LNYNSSILHFPLEPSTLFEKCALLLLPSRWHPLVSSHALRLVAFLGYAHISIFRSQDFWSSAGIWILPSSPHLCLHSWGLVILDERFIWVNGGLIVLRRLKSKLFRRIIKNLDHLHFLLCFLWVSRSFALLEITCREKTLVYIWKNLFLVFFLWEQPWVVISVIRLRKHLFFSSFKASLFFVVS